MGKINHVPREKARLERPNLEKSKVRRTYTFHAEGFAATECHVYEGVELLRFEYVATYNCATRADRPTTTKMVHNCVYRLYKELAGQVMASSLHFEVLLQVPTEDWYGREAWRIVRREIRVESSELEGVPLKHFGFVDVRKFAEIYDGEAKR